MLGLSWIACAWILRRFQVSRRLPARLKVAGTALILLLVGEFLVSGLFFGRTLMDHLAHYRAAEAQVGLAAQLLFASFPLVRHRTISASAAESFR
jgi:hypothetical protein